MELAGFTPRPAGVGDTLPAKEAVDKPLVVLVREHRTGIVTKFKPDGGDGVIVDVADSATDEVWVNVLWMNGAVCDNLAPYTGQAVPVKLVWQASAKGGNSYICPAALEGDELATAGVWAQNNPHRFDTERQKRNTEAAQQQPASDPAPAAPETAAPEQVKPADPNDPAIQALLAQLGGGQTPPAA